MRSWQAGRDGCGNVMGICGAGVTVALALGMLSGCGSSTSSSTTTTTRVVVQNIEADQGHARDQLLTTIAFPPGWTSRGSVNVGKSTDESSTNVFSETQSSELASCLGEKPQFAVEGAEAGSPTFMSPDSNSTVDDSAFVYASAADATSDFPPFGNPKLPACVVNGHEKDIADGVASQFATGTTGGTPTATLGTFPSYGDESGVINIVVPLSFPDRTHGTDNISFLMIRQGRSIAQLVMDSYPGTFVSSTAQSLAQTVTQHMKSTPQSSNA